MNKLSDKELISHELKKCSKDYAYTLKTYAKIKRPKKGQILFDLYYFQEKLIDMFQTESRSIILKGRQLGISTIVAGFLALEMCFKSDFEACVIAKDGDSAKNIVKKVAIMIKSFPSWLTPNKIIADNKYSLEVSNGSSIKAFTSTENAGRSESLDCLVLDEAAFSRYAADIWVSAKPTLDTGGSAIVLSTPNGVGNWFHKTWKAAEDGINGFAFIKLPWSVHPDRDQAWRDREDMELGSKRKASQENDCNFLTSGDTVIPGLKIKELESLTSDPMDKKGPDNQLWVWKYPEPKHQYLICADVSLGGDGDYCAAHVLDLMSVEQVAEYKSHITPGDFGHMLVSLAEQYNQALLVIENNGLGMAAIQPAIDKEYQNLFWSKKGTLDFVDPRRHSYSLMNDKDVRPGFNTNTRTRPLIIQKFEDYINDDGIKINSKRTIDEIWTFIFQRGKAVAQKDYHDDLIMALSIGLWVRDTALRLENYGRDFDKRRPDWIVYAPGLEHDLVYTTGMKQDPYKVNMGGDKEEDMREWI